MKPESSHSHLPEQWQEGIALFNRGQFFECHEALETVWLRTDGAPKALLQGLIQIAVAFYHLRRGNFPGSSRLLRAGLEKLSQAGSREIADLDTFIAELTPLPERIAAGQVSPDQPAPAIPF